MWFMCQDRADKVAQIGVGKHLIILAAVSKSGRNVLRVVSLRILKKQMSLYNRTVQIMIRYKNMLSASLRMPRPPLLD